MNITLIEKTDGSDPTTREEYWRRELKTVTPYALKTIDWLLYLGKLHRQIHNSHIFYQQYLLFMFLGFRFWSVILFVAMCILFLEIMLESWYILGALDTLAARCSEMQKKGSRWMQTETCWFSSISNFFNPSTKLKTLTL